MLHIFITPKLFYKHLRCFEFIYLMNWFYLFDVFDELYWKCVKPEPCWKCLISTQNIINILKCLKYTKMSLKIVGPFGAVYMHDFVCVMYLVTQSKLLLFLLLWWVLTAADINLLICSLPGLLYTCNTRVSMHSSPGLKSHHSAWCKAWLQRTKAKLLLQLTELSEERLLL